MAKTTLVGGVTMVVDRKITKKCCWVKCGDANCWHEAASEVATESQGRVKKQINTGAVSEYLKLELLVG